MRPHVLELHVYVNPHLYIHNVTCIASEIKTSCETYVHQASGIFTLHFQELDTYVHGLFLTKALSWISSLCRLCLPYDLLYNLIEEGLLKAEVKLIFFFIFITQSIFRRLPLSGLFQFSLIVSCFHQAQFLRLRQWRDIIPIRSRVCP